uniref:NADH-ubiquinone oxidoreductase chain 5 n=1 Tax=Protankyra bidentata TaxID=2904677 RepID=A0AAU7E453_9ECHN
MSIYLGSLLSSVSFLVLFLVFFSFLFISLNSNGIWGLSEGQVCCFFLKTSTVLCVGLIVIYSILGGGAGSSVFNFHTGVSSDLISFIFDQYSLFFFFVGALITWSIIEFSIYYMNEDVFSYNFFRLLMIFLLNMLILVCADSLFVLFIGWEGVGILSFILISWWKTRQDAQGASLQAIIYNRVGDLGLILLVFYSVSVFGLWSLNSFFLVCNESESLFLLFCGLFAASGKSSQFGFHPWLPSAMEGPTPVSALLHSSTMVVAGVFLLIRLLSVLGDQAFILWVCFLLGGLTSLFASTVALFQYDFKKVVAYSTTSQLGLMVCGIGLGQPLLSFFHICTHAFFKAMLFLCSGSIIHSFGNEQDLRKLGGVSKSVPITFSCIAVGSAALAGIPFLSGFYSKDLILESVVESSVNLAGAAIMFVAAMLTAVYSFRVIFCCSGINGSVGSLHPVSEESVFLIFPIIRLVVGSIFFGWLVSFFLFDLSVFFTGFISKIFPILFLSLGIFYYISYFSGVGLLLSKGISSFFIDQWGFSHYIHSKVSSLFYSLGIIFSFYVDLRALSLLPENLSRYSSLVSSIYSQFVHQGSLKSQVFVIFLLLLVIIFFFLL